MEEQVVLDVQRALVEKLAEALLLAGAAFVFTLVIGRWWIRWLKAHNIGKSIRVDGPQSHQIKTGTPTMGGVMVIAAVVLLTVMFNLWGRWSMLLPIAMLVSYGILGGFDGKHGEFYGEDRDAGRPVKVRYTWDKLDKDHALWEQAFSYDNRTWETNWTADFTRADPAKVSSSIDVSSMGQ